MAEKSNSPSRRQYRKNKPSCAYIVQKKEDESFRKKWSFADHKDFILLCNSFPGLNRSDLAVVFKAHNYDVQKAMSALPESKPGIVASNMTKHPSPRRHIKLCLVRDQKWFLVSKMRMDKRALEETLKSMNKKFTLKYVKSAVDKLMCRLVEVKKMVAMKMTPTKYNEIDFHGLKLVEAYFIMGEALYHYSAALKRYPDMKPFLNCITGKGKHSPKGIPVLKNAMIEYLNVYKIKYQKFDGCIRVYLGNFAQINL